MDVRSIQQSGPNTTSTGRYFTTNAKSERSTKSSTWRNAALFRSDEQKKPQHKKEAGHEMTDEPYRFMMSFSALDNGSHSDDDGSHRGGEHSVAFLAQQTMDEPTSIWTIALFLQNTDILLLFDRSKTLEKKTPSCSNALIDEPGLFFYSASQRVV
jgi:hypothetical protein